MGLLVNYSELPNSFYIANGEFGVWRIPDDMSSQWSCEMGKDLMSHGELDRLAGFND